MHDEDNLVCGFAVLLLNSYLLTLEAYISRACSGYPIAGSVLEGLVLMERPSDIP